MSPRIPTFTLLLLSLLLSASLSLSLAFDSQCTPTGAVRYQARNLTVVYPRLYPESFEYEPCGNYYITGSIRTNGIYQVNPRSGRVRVWSRIPVSADAAAVGSFGVQLDYNIYNGKRLLAAIADTSTGRDWATVPGVYAGLAAFDATERKFLWSVDLRTTLNEEQRLRPHAANDVVASPDGTAYVTDPPGGMIWRVSADGETAEVWLDRPDFAAASGFGVNGIEYLDGHIITTNSGTGAIFKIRISDKQVSLISVTPPQEVRGDGIRFVDGRLVTVQGGTQVVAYESIDGFSSMTEVSRFTVPAEWAVTTTAYNPRQRELWAVSAFVADNGLPTQTREVFGLQRVGF